MQNKPMHILAVGCHPDDIELGCGGTIAKHRSLGDEVYALILTNGEKGNHAPNHEECLASLKKLNVDHVFFGNFRDGYVVDNQQVVEFIETIIKRHAINRVYTHDPRDRHQDHRNGSRAVSAAARKVPEIFLFQGPSTHPTFEPHYFVELSKDQITKKLSALKCFKSQIHKGIVNLRWIEQLAGVHGASCNTQYAEAFALNHMFKRGKYV